MCQYAPSERSRLISVMGYLASKLEHKFPPWFHFLFPSDEIDRKNWSITVNGEIFVSTSKAVRNGGIQFMNRDTILDFCEICKCIMNHRSLVYMKYIVWKKDWTGSDTVQWMTSNTKACYIHWRKSTATQTPMRNPWTIERQLNKRKVSKNFEEAGSSSPPAFGNAVLPLDLI